MQVTPEERDFFKEELTNYIFLLAGPPFLLFLMVLSPFHEISFNLSFSPIKATSFQFVLLFIILFQTLVNFPSKPSSPPSETAQVGWPGSLRLFWNQHAYCVLGNIASIYFLGSYSGNCRGSQPGITQQSQFTHVFHRLIRVGARDARQLNARW